MLLRDVFLLVLINVLWGSTDVVAKSAMLEISPGALMCLRFTITLLAFVPFLIIRRAGIPRQLRGLAPFIGLGMCGFFLNHVLQYEGLNLAPPSHSTALRGSESLMIVLLSWLVLRERIGKWAVVGLLFGSLGAVIVLDIDFSNLGLFTRGARLGDLLILCGILVESNYTIIAKKTTTKIDPVIATALACFFGWIMLVVFYGPSTISEFTARMPSAKALAGCAYLGLVATVFCYSVYLTVLKRRPSNKVAMSILIQPLAGIPLAAILFHDRISVKFLIGAVMILLGVYLALGMEKNGNAQVGG